MSIFDRNDRCPPHNWTKWETKTERWERIVGWGKNRQFHPYDQDLQSRRCVKCGYTKQECVN